MLDSYKVKIFLMDYLLFRSNNLDTFLVLFDYLLEHCQDDLEVTLFLEELFL